MFRQRSAGHHIFCTECGPRSAKSRSTAEHAQGFILHQTILGVHDLWEGFGKHWE